jgi:exodeoxyribonuclease V beta subunit
LSASEKHKAPDYFKRTCEIIFNTLKVPLDNEGFRICDLAKNDRLNEVEFYFSLPEIDKSEAGNFRFKDGFLKGFIDLVYRKNGRYFFADWKSNRYPEFSGKEFIDRVKADYELQYKVYSIAVVKWLRSRMKNFDYDEHFGGIYYIYLRGRYPDNIDNGLFFYRESNDPTAVYENDLKNILHK